MSQTMRNTFFEIQADEDTQLQIVPALLHNEPIRVRLQFRKQMEAPRYSEMNDALEQVRFGIFAASDICFSNGGCRRAQGNSRQCMQSG